MSASASEEALAVPPVSAPVDALLGLSLFLLLCRLFQEFSTNVSFFLYFFFSLAVVYLYVLFVRHFSLKVAMSISRLRVGPSIPPECQQPMNSSLLQRKVMDQSWQLAIHVLMSCMGFYLMKDTTWLSDTASTFDPCPLRFRSGELSRPLRLNIYYIFQLSIWMWTAFSCKWLESRRKDYVEMMIHHLVTIVLVLGSFLYQEHPMGMLVLIVHDFSDIFLDLMKLANYMKLENAHGYYITELCFFVNTFVSWPILRLYYFPVKVIYEGVFVGYGEKCGYGDNFIEKCYNVEGTCFGGGLLLCVLAILHVYWFYLMLRIFYKMTTTCSPAMAGAAVYEGKDDRTKED